MACQVVGKLAYLVDQVSLLVEIRVAYRLEVPGSREEGNLEACRGQRHLVLVGSLKVVVACLRPN